MALGFFEGWDPNINTKLRERIAMQMMQQRRQYPKTVGEGLSAIGDALGDIGMMRRLEAADLQQQREADEKGARYSSLAPSMVNTATPAATAPAAALTRATTPVAYAPSDTRVTTAPDNQRPPATRVEDGGYNVLDAQADLPTPVRVRGELQDAIDSQTDNPDMQSYLRRLNAREEDPNDQYRNSPTGASGPYQFTRGTGRDYGLVSPGVDERQVDVPATRAALQFTRDNAAAFEGRFGRPPTQAELAVMHQQGAGGGMNLLAGQPTVSRNLAVNGVSPGTAPAAAAQQIMNYYGMPNRPIDPRAQVASALVNQSGAGGPQANPTEAGGVAPASPPVPSPQEATGFRDSNAQMITPAPKPPQIAPMPAARPPADYIMPRPQKPVVPQMAQPDLRELELSNEIAKAQVRGNDYVVQRLSPILQRMQEVRKDENTRRVEEWKKDMELYNSNVGRFEEQSASAAKRAADYEKLQQEIEQGKRPKVEDIEGKVYYDPAQQAWVRPKIVGDDPNAMPNPKLTEDQRKTVMFHDWMSLGQEQMQGKDKLLAEGLRQELAGRVPFFGNKLQEAEYKRVRDAAARFVQGFLRSTSGAAIGAKELSEHQATFIPRYGDTAQQIADKRAARENLVNSMYSSLGPGRQIADYSKRQRDTERAAKDTRVNAEMEGVEKVVGKPLTNKRTGVTRVWTGTRWDEY